MAQRATTIELPEGAVLSISHDDGAIRHVSSTGDVTDLGSLSLHGSPRELVFAMSGDAAIVVIAHVGGEVLHVVRLTPLGSSTLPLVERLPRVRELALIRTPGLVLAVCENGIVAIDGDGGERWRRCETTYGWRFVGALEGGLYFADLSDDLRRLDARSGEESSF